MPTATTPIGTLPGCALNWTLDRLLYWKSKQYPDGQPLMSWADLRSRELVPCKCDEDDCDGYCAQPRGQSCKCPKSVRPTGPAGAGPIAAAKRGSLTEEEPEGEAAPPIEIETPERVIF